MAKNKNAQDMNTRNCNYDKAENNKNTHASNKNQNKTENKAQNKTSNSYNSTETENCNY